MTPLDWFVKSDCTFFNFPENITLISVEDLLRTNIKWTPYLIGFSRRTDGVLSKEKSPQPTSVIMNSCYHGLERNSPRIDSFFTFLCKFQLGKVYPKIESKDFNFVSKYFTSKFILDNSRVLVKGRDPYVVTWFTYFHGRKILQKNVRTSNCTTKGDTVGSLPWL